MQVPVDQNRQFLERIVVWPGSKNDPGWINLHVHSKNRDPSKNGGKDWVVGWPFKTVDDFISRAKWSENTDNFYDCWYCTSQQSQIGETRTGKAKAVRSQRNATFLKAIWIDVDVKPDDPEKHYTTLQEAWAAVSAFIRKVGLPKPSALVNSGGGWHVYWESDLPLTREAWAPYAEGLKQLLLQEGIKCDSGLTTDAARILRVPGTLNHKYNPPRPVQLLHLGVAYNFPQALGFLTKVAPASAQPNTTSPADVVDPAFAATAPDPAFAALAPASNDLSAGIEFTGPGKLLDPRPIFAQCGFMRTAIATGGRDYDNPLWNLTVLCTAFMENGNAFAHEVSKGHAGYTPADTQALFDRKMADRSERDVGYPSCATIAGAGCKSCATCPLFGKGKSPLNIRPIITATVTPAKPQSQTAVSLQLPDGYDVDGTGIICRLEEKRTRDGDVQEIWHQLFYTRIENPWVQKDPDMIHFQASYDKGNKIWTAVKHDDWCGQGYEKKLAAAKVKYRPSCKGMLEEFFMAWLSKMHDAAVAQTAQAFGWYHEAGARRGFAYGGFVHKDDGMSPQAGLTDRRIQKRFQPVGEASPWHRALGYITMQKRPELETIVAASFAAPLLDMTGTVGAMLSSHGTSGVGKTYALEVGAAVWGHPKESKEVTSSTWKSVEQRLASTVNLPVFWDEITNAGAQANVLEMLMLTTGGVRGGRLNQNTDQREKGTWSTLLVINSNLCFKEFVAARQATHTAGINRVFEYEIVPPEHPVGIVSKHEAAQALLELRHNYGNVGLDYARYIGQNHEAVQARVNQVLDALEAKLQPTEEDRFWIAMLGALMVGAELANQVCGAGFDLVALESFLLETYAKNGTNRVEAQVSPNLEIFAEDQLTQFLKDHTMSTIWCASTPTGVGKGRQIDWHRQFPNAPLPHGIHIRMDYGAKQIMLSVRRFNDWCEAEKKSATAVMQSLQKHYNITRDRRSLAAGTGLGGGQERALIIDCAGHADLEDLLLRQPDNSDLGASVGMSASVVDTGIATPDGESGGEADCA